MSGKLLRPEDQLLIYRRTGHSLWCQFSVYKELPPRRFLLLILSASKLIYYHQPSTINHQPSTINHQPHRTKLSTYPEQRHSFLLRHNHHDQYTYLLPIFPSQLLDTQKIIIHIPLTSTTTARPSSTLPINPDLSHTKQVTSLKMTTAEYTNAETRITEIDARQSAINTAVHGSDLAGPEHADARWALIQEYQDLSIEKKALKERMEEIEEEEKAEEEAKKKAEEEEAKKKAEEEEEAKKKAEEEAAK
ncbi:uncharacterized protein GGS25DRAFT_531364 [Hypoxylon fragiforme]|uniref:uncharacterized protein n=1 Tax=Hypoxylon fragiforme TaxID=63214 RepID=UPI0020C680DA|nr:uncharacterized protein GGS25DRAFT_531364 [Hypoxylon fragiforme]KAI2608180.1 hypothetical protein GGS25DRAFT_531364 [Hypoxylon fragiforme]